MTESYDEFVESKKKNDNNQISSIASKLSPIHIIIIFALILVGNNLLKNKENNWVLWAIGFLAILVFAYIFRKDNQRSALSRSLAQRIAHQDLSGDIGVGKTYLGGTTITPTNYFWARYWDNTDGKGRVLTSYYFGFKIKEPNKQEREIIYRMNPFTGEARGLIGAPLGFTGLNDEIKDVKLIPAEFISKEVKKE